MCGRQIASPTRYRAFFLSFYACIITCKYGRPMVAPTNGCHLRTEQRGVIESKKRAYRCTKENPEPQISVRGPLVKQSATEIPWRFCLITLFYGRVRVHLIHHTVVPLPLPSKGKAKGIFVYYFIYSGFLDTSSVTAKCDISPLRGRQVHLFFKV